MILVSTKEASSSSHSEGSPFRARLGAGRGHLECRRRGEVGHRTTGSNRVWDAARQCQGAAAAHLYNKEGINK